MLDKRVLSTSCTTNFHLTILGILGRFLGLPLCNGIPFQATDDITQNCNCMTRLLGKEVQGYMNMTLYPGCEVQRI